MCQPPTPTGGGNGSLPGPGEERLRKVMRTIPYLRGKPRKDAPVPYDDTWGWWVQERIVALEHKVNLILTLATTAVLSPSPS
jgi:hypothetical protein